MRLTMGQIRAGSRPARMPIVITGMNGVREVACGREGRAAGRHKPLC